MLYKVDGKEYKICSKCKDLKIVDDFFKRKTSADGYRNDCKACSKLSDQKRSGKRKEQRQTREILTEGVKICRICGDEKELSEFHIKRGTVDGHRSECKECVKDIKKKYDNPEKRKEYDKKRYDENKEQILERKKEYHQENRDKILHQKEQYRNDPKNSSRIKDYLENYREEHRQEMRDYIKKYKVENREKYYKYRNDNPHIIAWRSVLHSTLKRMNTSKSDHTIKLLGYSADELKEHIQSQFQPGMSWENHGDWHIDHIIPVTKFDSDSPINEVCALGNLQPLWAFDNLSKSNKLEF